jgi:alcohol dehydrogenase
MKAWMLDQPGQPLALRDIDTPHARPGAVLVRMEAVPLLSYTRDYLNGALPYAYPPGPFTPVQTALARSSKPERVSITSGPDNAWPSTRT